MTDLQAKTLDRVLEIQEKAAGRMVRSKEEGRVTEVVVLHFDKTPQAQVSSKPKCRRRGR